MSDETEIAQWVETLFRVLEPMTEAQRATVISRVVDRLDLCP